MSRIIRYLALGDSFTIGTGIPPERAFPSLVAARRGYALTNPAVNGYTTDDLIARELPLVAELDPDVVTVLIGANDIISGSGAERYREQLARIFGSLEDVPQVVALPQPDWAASPAGRRYAESSAPIEEFNAVMRDEAARAGARYLDLWRLMRRQAAAGMLAPDGLHPSEAAHAQWAEALARQLEEA